MDGTRDGLGGTRKLMHALGALVSAETRREIPLALQLSKVRIWQLAA